MVTAWYRRGPGAHQLRLAHYVPQAPGGLLYGEHTDYDGLTFLWRNSDNGLQARVEDIWCDIPLLEEDRDALLINLGDLMEFWTRGTWVSPLHRVANIRPRGDQGQAPHLVSIVMFAGQIEHCQTSGDISEPLLYPSQLLSLSKPIRIGWDTEAHANVSRNSNVRVRMYFC